MSRAPLGPSAARRPLRVAFLPRYPENPYQDLLAAGLRECQVEVSQFTIGNFSLRRRPRPHVLHLHWLHPFCTATTKSKALLRLGRFLTQWFAMKLRGTKIVWTAHNLHDHAHRQPALDRFLTGFVARRADAIIVHSRSAAAALSAAIPRVNGSKLHVVPHGNYIGTYPDEQDRDEARAELQIDPQAMVVLFLGAVRRYKGIVELLSAWKRLPPVTGRLLVIAGAPGDAATDALVRQAASEMTGVRYLPGLVPDDRIQTFMRAADVVVLPYRESLTSGALVLAMSFGKAVIVPRLPLFCDLLEEDRAVFYDPADEVALAAAIDAAERLRDRLPQMGAANRRSVAQWSWSRVAELTRSVYDTGDGNAAPRAESDSVSACSEQELAPAIKQT